MPEDGEWEALCILPCFGICVLRRLSYTNNSLIVYSGTAHMCWCGVGAACFLLQATDTSGGNTIHAIGVHGAATKRVSGRSFYCRASFDLGYARVFIFYESCAKIREVGASYSVQTSAFSAALSYTTISLIGYSGTARLCWCWGWCCLVSCRPLTFQVAIPYMQSACMLLPPDMSVAGHITVEPVLTLSMPGYSYSRAEKRLKDGK
jgi:hypothetical protein